MAADISSTAFNLLWKELHGPRRHEDEFDEKSHWTGFWLWTAVYIGRVNLPSISNYWHGIDTGYRLSTGFACAMWKEFEDFLRDEDLCKGAQLWIGTIAQKIGDPDKEWPNAWDGNKELNEKRVALMREKANEFGKIKWGDDYDPEREKRESLERHEERNRKYAEERQKK